MISIPFPLFYDDLKSNLQGYSSVLLITDAPLYQLYGNSLFNYLENASMKTFLILVPEGERAKTIENAATCWDLMANYRMDRQSAIVALGGGSITDLSAFVAGCYMRGIDFFLIPTTLLGMADAAIGGKCGVNLSTGKNLVGLFNRPQKTFTYPEFLLTLSDREFRAGIAEVIKYGVIDDVNLFNYLSEHSEKILKRDPSVIKVIIERSQQIKNKIIENDFLEENLRAILNFGHTLGHALELETKYEIYLHGEAVSIGMCWATKISAALGFCPKEIVDSLEQVCKLFKLPTTIKAFDYDIEKIISIIKHDKKNKRDKISLILVKRIGEVFQHEITIDELRALLNL